MPYTITRQCQWPEGNLMVEISYGGIDYCNPDALIKEYDGEFKEFEDPREALKVAFSIRDKWKKDSGEEISIGVGYTGGMTMPFEPSSDDELIEWAEKEYEKLEKCPICNEIMEGKYEYYLRTNVYPDGEVDIYYDGYKYCSEKCATFIISE